MPDGRHYVRESTINKDPNRLDRRINSYLRKQGYASRDVITDMSVVNMNTGMLVRFTFEFIEEWRVEVRVRSLKNDICPFTMTHWCLTEEETKKKVRDYSIYF